MHPYRARFDADGRLRRVLPRAALRYEGVVQHHLVHWPRPDQQRIGGVRGSLVAVPAALDDQAQFVVAREVHRGNDIGGGLGRHRIGAGCRHPGVDPAGGLGSGRLIADVIGISQQPEQVLAGRGVGRIPARRDQRLNLDQSAADTLVELLPTRLPRPRRVGWAHATEPSRQGYARSLCRRADQRRWGRRSQCKQVSSVHLGTFLSGRLYGPGSDVVHADLDEGAH